MSNSDGSVEIPEAARQAALKSVSAGGESATYDTGALKAAVREAMGKDPALAADARNRRVFNSFKIRDRIF